MLRWLKMNEHSIDQLIFFEEEIEILLDDEELLNEVLTDGS